MEDISSGPPGYKCPCAPAPATYPNVHDIIGTTPNHTQTSAFSPSTLLFKTLKTRIR